MKLITLFLLISFCCNVFAIDVNLLQNNKEAYSRLISKQKQRQVNVWLTSQNQNDLKNRIYQFLKDTLDFFSLNGECELQLARLMIEKAQYYNLASDKYELYTLLNYLRLENHIDDIFLRISSNLIDLEIRLIEMEGSKPVRPFNASNDVTREIDIAKTYAPFKIHPDEKSQCAISSWRRLIFGLGWDNLRNRDLLMKKLNYLAFSEGAIELQTYQTLELLRDYNIIDWDITLYQYLDVIKNAKDKLRKPDKPSIRFSNFSSTIVSRKEKITHRERLFKEYTSTQIMMLADIIQKTSRRMDARRISINFENPELPTETEIYVLSPMERYRLSLKMLRKDMAETMRSELFQGKVIQYEDLVSAAFETGLIESQDLEMILKFEEFWNPKIPRWKMYANFAFQMAGSASFYLPPPFNILGALALAITQTKVINQDQKPDSNDNWNVVI